MKTIVENINDSMFATWRSLTQTFQMVNELPDGHEKTVILKRLTDTRKMLERTFEYTDNLSNVENTETL